MARIIAHLDMDAFFAAIEERDRPELAGRPVVVGADPRGGRGRGVVSTANYTARAYGIHSAQPIATAWRLSEEAAKAGKKKAVFLPVSMEKYSLVSAEVMKIVRNKVQIVEQTSVDEAYLDLSFTGSFENSERVMREIKAEIKKKERLTASVGIGPNKLIAKIASDLDKPDGLRVVRPKEAQGVLDPLAARVLPGVGPKSSARLSELGAQTIGDLRDVGLRRLTDLFGKAGLNMYEMSRGRDDSPVTEEREPKSVGEQETFDEDTLDSGFLTERMEKTAERVYERLKQQGFTRFKTVVVTVRFANFVTHTRSRSLKVPDSTVDALKFTALALFLPFLDKRENPHKNLIRLVGVRVENLS
ncbi:MAG: DNA polymerase IV [Patescibacteria group bacterium]|nr:DNA polymerase IV [Patescibacteria group bacterium]